MTVAPAPVPEVDSPQENMHSETVGNQNENDPFAPSLAKLQFCLSLVQIFVISLTVRICFNFATTHPNCSFVGDASEYLREAAVLSTPIFQTPEFLRHAFELLIGSASPSALAQIHQQTAVLNELKVAGPVFPLFLLSCFSIAGQPASVEHWQFPVLAQCILSSFTCILIALTARRAWNRTTGVVAGAIAALYPSFIISTGSLYTETFAAFLYSCIAFITVSSIMSRPVTNLACFFLGLVSAALQLTRPPAVLLSLCAFPFVVWQRRGKSVISATSCLLLGFALICAPYLVFQKVAFNTTSLIVNRRASENLFMGNSNQTQGWIAMPFTWMPPEDKRASFVVQKSLANPRQSIQLLVDKLIRLLKFPYNDYRLSLGPVGFPRQVLYHQLIILFATLGMVTALFGNPGKQMERLEGVFTQKQRLQAKLCLLSLACSNLTYIAFVAMARYFFPAMPIAIMFAAAGIVSLVSYLRFKSYPLILTVIAAVAAMMISAQINFAPLLLKIGFSSSILAVQTIDFAIRLIPVICLTCISILVIRSSTTGRYRLAGYVLALVTLMLVIPAACLPSRANGRSLETTFVLNRPGDILTQEITAPPSLGPAYLMLDLDGIKSLDGLAVYVNGTEVSSRFIPNLSLTSSSPAYRHQQGNSFYLEIENLFHCLALPSKISSCDLRQWFLLPLPGTVTEAKSVSGSTQTRSIKIELRKTNFATSTIYGQFARNKTDLMVPSVSSQSTEKAFCCVESPFHLGDPRFDSRVKLLKGASQTESTSGRKIEAIPNIRLLSNPEGVALDTSEMHISLPDQQVSDDQKATVCIQPHFPAATPFEPQTLLLRFHGKVKTLRGRPSPHLDLQIFSLKNGLISGYDSPWTPSRIYTDNNWQDFNFTVPVAASELPGVVQSLNLVTSDGDPQQQLLRKPHSKSLFAFKDSAIEVSQLSNQPLEPGYVLY